MRQKTWPLSCLAMLLGCWLLTRAHGADRPDIVIADFEGRDYGDWQATGDAFGTGPAHGTLPGQQTVSGYLGNGLVNTFLGGDPAQGTLRSRPFALDRKYLNLLIGGGRHPDETCVKLFVDDQVVRTATGNATTGADDEHLSWHTWDVQPWIGKQARIEIVDRHSGGWGHINVDQLVQSDQPEIDPQIEPGLAQADSSVRGAAARAAADPARPAYHFLPPALWTNDPNGPLYHAGQVHLFYQHNPYGDRWEHMHWGHARSRDLVHWEHLPIALAPSQDRGEEHCFSGCAARNAQGEPMLFYTSIGRRDPEQWVALPDDDQLLRWHKAPGNPILSLRLHGDQQIDDWRDPFVFASAGRTFLVCGGHPRGGRGSVMLYEALDGSLLQWKYRGVAFTGEEGNWECPNLFPLGQRYVLIYSPHGPVRYYVGDFDPDAGRLSPQQRGVLDVSDDFYAPNGLALPDGRWIMWGWVRNFPGGRGWNGCMTLPRELQIGTDGNLLQRPATEVAKLRSEQRVQQRGLALPAGATPVEGLAGECLEIAATLRLGSARQMALEVHAGDQQGASVSIAWNGKHLSIGERSCALQLGANEPLRLRVFVDRSVVEVYANDRVAMTKVVEIGQQPRYVWNVVGQGAHLDACDAWRLESAWTASELR
ncbi:MAG: glycoside hydrolase family 32 protein [Pirellulales bacterium]|nr:glycoside hydrolase family 32 protein [Pirellulales bacterium]